MNFQYHAELNVLVVILAGGDIITLEIDADYSVCGYTNVRVIGNS